MLYTKLCFVLYFSTVCFCKKYTNYTVYRVTPVNEEHLDYLRRLEEKYDVNFWRRPGAVNKPVEFSISPRDNLWFLNDSATLQLYSTTILKDLQSAFDKQSVRSYTRRNMGTFGWDSYYKLEDIYAWLEDLAQANKQYAKVYDIGQTLFRRPIKVIEINFNQKKKPKIIIEGGIHAREWISPAFVTYFINHIFEAPSGSDDQWKKIVEGLHWFIVPVINPDGYAYTHAPDGDRLWRKNRRGSGIDLNRNFDYHFKNEAKPKADDFEGYGSFSEKETVAMSNFIKKHNKDLRYYLGFHAYGQFIIIPYGDSTKHLENFKEVKSIANSMIQKIQRRYGTTYVSGSAYDCVGYTVTGGSADWAKQTYKIPYALYFELRDEGVDGFTLNEKKIKPTSKEMVDGLKYLFHATLTPKMLSQPGGAEWKQSDIASLVIMEIVYCFVLRLILLA